MKNNFQPDYINILNAINRVRPNRIPFYEHLVDDLIMEKVLNRKFSESVNGDIKDKENYYSNIIDFFVCMGYDIIPFSKGITTVFPDGGALYSNKTPAIKNRKDFDDYPWSDIPGLFFNEYETDYEIMARLLPGGMSLVGGPGNGIFECVQDLTGLSNLSLIAVDDPILYKSLFNKTGEVLYEIWDLFLKKFSKEYVFFRFGDDLGFKTSTILKPDDINALVIPNYKKIISLVHSYNKPFLLHSCGNIFSIMDYLIDEAKIDAKHSNEDSIAPFFEWQKRFGKKIALFGGIDMNILCTSTESEIKKYTLQVLKQSARYEGYAFGTGNSIANYVPVKNYIKMMETAREFRGE